MEPRDKRFGKRPERDSLTPKEAGFVEGLKDGLQKTAACREAGFADPNGEADRLLARPGVVAALVKALQQSAAKWTHLKALSMNALADVLSLRAWGCRVAGCDGKAVCSHCGLPIVYPAVDPKTRTAAAVGALGLLSKIGDGKSLEDKAAVEDSALSPADATKAVLGRPASEGVALVMIPPEDSLDN